MRIGIFGGTFDPVHAGHVRLACCALSELNLDKVIFVPARQNPLKKRKPLFSPAARAERLRKALRPYPAFEISPVELEREGPSYTVDTLKHFRRAFGGRCVLYFLSGADTTKHLRRWKSPREIFKLCRFVVMTRPGHSLRGVPPEALVLPFDALPVSATGIRRGGRNRGA